jgi:hypothetical protein
MSDTSAGGLDSLQEHLFRIPEAEFTALVHELEQRRLNEARARKISLIMSFLRPRLAILKPFRRMTLLRLLCMPFEDILYNPGSPRKAIGKIPRNAIRSVWDLLRENADKARVTAFEEQLASMPMEEQTAEALLEVGQEFWPFCAYALRGVIVVAEGSTRLRRELIDKMGDDNHFASLKEVVSMLEVADPIMTLRTNLSRGPIETVSNRDLDAIIAAFTAVNTKGPNYQECVIYVILARLADMASITDVFQRIDDAGAGAVITQVSDTASQAMVSQIEDQIKDMDDDIAIAPDRETLARQAENYVNTLAGAAKAIGQTGSRQQSRRVGQVRGELADKVRINVLEEGDDSTAALLASMLSASFSDFDDDDDDDAASQEMLEKMQDRIVSLRVAERYADDIGLGGEVEQRLTAIESGLSKRADKLLGTLNIGSDRSRAEANLNGTVRLIELVSGPESADDFRTRGRALLDGE